MVRSFALAVLAAPIITTSATAKQPIARDALVCAALEMVIG